MIEHFINWFQETAKENNGTTISVLALPPRESCNSLVNLELRYGTWDALPSAKEEITFPSVESDQLILEASRNRRPDVPLLVCRSLPAKSTYFQLKNEQFNRARKQFHRKKNILDHTKLSRPTWRVLFPSIAFSLHSTATVKMAWEREEWMFICVAPTEPIYCIRIILVSGLGKFRKRFYDSYCPSS